MENNTKQLILKYIGITLAEKTYKSYLKGYDHSNAETARIFSWKTESILKQIKKDKNALKRQYGVTLSLSSSNKDEHIYKWSTKNDYGQIKLQTEVLNKLLGRTYYKYWCDKRIKVKSKGWEPNTSLPIEVTPDELDLHT